MSKEDPPAPSKPVVTKPAPAAKPAAPAAKAAMPRRSFLSWMTLAWTAFTASMLAAATATTRFMFPNVLFEPPPTFKAGLPSEIQVGQVDERYQAKVRRLAGSQRLRSMGKVEWHLCAVHRLYPSRLHAKLAGSRAEVQVPLPWQWLLQNRCEL